MKAMILAAGAGTRLRPLTYETSKPMVPVVNRPVIHHVLDNLSRHGVREVAVNLHVGAEQVRSFCGDGSKWHVRITYSHEKTLLGTAGAVKKLQNFFKDSAFFVLSGDGLCDINLTDFWKFHKSKKSLATMALKQVDQRFDYGVTMTDKGARIKGFMEKPSWGDIFSNKVNTGIYLFEPEVLSFMPAGRFYDFGHQLWPKLLKMKKRIYGYEMDGYWCDVGNLSEYRRSQKDALEGRIRLNIPGRQISKRVWVDEGSRLHPDAVLKAPCLIGKNCKIGPGAVIGPDTVLGDGCEVGAKALLKNCILFDQVRVGSEVHLSNCIIGERGNVTENIAVYGATVLNIRQ